MVFTDEEPEIVPWDLHAPLEAELFEDDDGEIWEDAVPGQGLWDEELDETMLGDLEDQHNENVRKPEEAEEELEDMVVLNPPTRVSTRVNAVAASVPPTVKLENYISRAQGQIRSCASRDPKVFNEATNVVPPMLRKGHLSRIIIYYGCFNPPHRSHRELVCHAFLRTDHRTIAVMIVPMDRVGGKDNTGIALTKSQRTNLWNDDVLGRFSWVFPGSHKDVGEFMETVRHITSRDGFPIEFTSLSGPDHHEGGISWPGSGTDNLITTDVTRPASSVVSAKGIPYPTPGCKSWKKVGQAMNETECWPCWKLKQIYPEHGDISLVNDTQLFGGDARAIMRRCHHLNGAIWYAKRRAGGYVWFFSSGRLYPLDDSRPAISSSIIRRILASPSDDHYEAIKDLAINPALLITMLGLSKGWHATKDNGNSD